MNHPCKLTPLFIRRLLIKKVVANDHSPLLKIIIISNLFFDDRFMKRSSLGPRSKEDLYIRFTNRSIRSSASSSLS
jgi:hypothetical protein